MVCTCRLTLMVKFASDLLMWSLVGHHALWALFPSSPVTVDLENLGGGEGTRARRAGTLESLARRRSWRGGAAAGSAARHARAVGLDVDAQLFTD